MPENRDETVDLLHRWHGGDRKALDALLDRHIDPLRRHVHAKLARELPHLRRHLDSMDLVQTAITRVLEYTPAFLPRDGRQFQNLLRRIVINDLRNEIRAPRVRRRAASTDLYGDSVLDLRAQAPSEFGPDRVLQEAEERQWARAWASMAMQFLSDEFERKLVLLAAVEERSWKEIGGELGLTASAARMRYQRLLPRLANHVRLLQEGRVEDLLAEHRA
jgi:RNA polymerase sigma factor (sigma-70 family)